MTSDSGISLDSVKNQLKMHAYVWSYNCNNVILHYIHVCLTNITEHKLKLMHVRVVMLRKQNKTTQPLLTVHITAIRNKKTKWTNCNQTMTNNNGGQQSGAVWCFITSYNVKGHDCCPPHWLSTGRRRSSSTCRATSMVSSKSKSPSGSSPVSFIGGYMP